MVPSSLGTHLRSRQPTEKTSLGLGLGLGLAGSKDIKHASDEEVACVQLHGTGPDQQPTTAMVHPGAWTILLVLNCMSYLRQNKVSNWLTRFPEHCPPYAHYCLTSLESGEQEGNWRTVFAR